MTKTFSSLNINGVTYKVKDKSSISAPISQGQPGQTLVIGANGAVLWKNINSIDSSVITTSLNKFDSSIKILDSSIDELHNKIEKIDSSMQQIITNLDNQNEEDENLEDYNLILDSSNHLIKVITPYNCEWSLKILIKDFDKLKEDILYKINNINDYVEECIEEKINEILNTYDSSYTIIKEGTSYDIINSENIIVATIYRSEIFDEEFQDYTIYIHLFSPKTCDEIKFVISNHEKLNELQNELDAILFGPYPYILSSLNGISSNYVTYSIDNTLDLNYYQKEYILQLKHNNQIKKTIQIDTF